MEDIPLHVQTLGCGRSCADENVILSPRSTGPSPPEFWEYDTSSVNNGPTGYSRVLSGLGASRRFRLVSWSWQLLSWSPKGSEVMRVILAAPRGFCAGVNMAVESLRLALDAFGPPVYVYHEIVHNQFVVRTFRDSGAVFVNSLDEIPLGSTVLFSAHGVSPMIRQTAKERNLKAIDATCPLVTKVHTEAIRFARGGYTIVLIGHEGHDEVIGTMGEAPEAIVLVEDTAAVDQLPFDHQTKLAYLTQTTLSVDDANRIIDRLKQRFPQIQGPPKDDICYATQNRQEAVRLLAQAADRVIVLGSQNSSNSQRLRELAEEHQRKAFLVDGPDDLRLEDFDNEQTVLITAGASAPESVVESTLHWLEQHFDVQLETQTVREEKVHFPLPLPLRHLASQESAGG